MTPRGERVYEEKEVYIEGFLFNQQYGEFIQQVGIVFEWSFKGFTSVIACGYNTIAHLTKWAGCPWLRRRAVLLCCTLSIR